MCVREFSWLALCSVVGGRVWWVGGTPHSQSLSFFPCLNFNEDVNMAAAAAVGEGGSRSSTAARVPDACRIGLLALPSAMRPLLAGPRQRPQSESARQLMQLDPHRG